jgi:predicted transposase/invertase (TIGR01784 family)
MLFGTNENKEILISLLNNLLGFKDEKEIKEVQINTSELPVYPFSKDKSKCGISSAVDVLCTTNSGQKIAIEMQRQNKKYFLTREQEYMGKLIASQVKEGEGALYHEKLLDTYILVIAKENIFTDKKYDFVRKGCFEIDVEPTVKQTQELYPGNKMYWKFFELAKFKNSDDYKKLKSIHNFDNFLKEQWLEFLIDCNTYKIEPERNDIIKKGYEIMKMTNWKLDTKILYERQVQDILDTQYTFEEKMKEKNERS